MPGARCHTDTRRAGVKVAPTERQPPARAIEELQRHNAVVDGIQEGFRHTSPPDTTQRCCSEHFPGLRAPLADSVVPVPRTEIETTEHFAVTARHIYVDETKNRGYVLAASVLMGPDVEAMRKTMRKLVLPGQHRIHMAKERDARRKEIADTICSAGVSAIIYDAGRRYGNELDARAACLESIIADIDAGQPTLLVIEQDDSLIHWDKQRLIEMVRASGSRDTLRYEHHRAKAELLLTIPDAIAWCWARGGQWRQRISAVTTVKHV